MARGIFTVFAIVGVSLSGTAQVQVNTINTVAGGGVQPSAATSAYLPQPVSSVRDSSGNTYISVPSLNLVYMVNSSGSLSVYAGSGIAGFSGDGGPASQAQLNFPEGLAIDSANNLFIADSNNERIRRVDAQTQAITTVAGSEDPYFGAYAGDGGAATNARLNSPQSVAVDANGNLFITDTANAVVRRVDAATQLISTYAGTTTPGNLIPGCNTGAATQGVFKKPAGIAIDGSGNLFISDTSLDIVCKVDPTQNISLYAGTLNTPGTPGAANGDGGPATLAQIDRPNGLATDAAGNLYITDSGNPKIRKVDAATQIISTIAGIGTICTSAGEPGCGDGLPPTRAFFDFPEGVFVDANKNILIADTGNMRVRVLSAATGTITNFAGSGTGGDNGVATGALLGLAQSLAVDANENVFALESAGERVRKLDTKGNINTVAGAGYGGIDLNCQQPCNGDGGASNLARFVEPTSLATDAQGNFYIVDRKASVIRVVNNQASAITVAGTTIQPGTIATVAGNGTQCNPGTAGYPTCGDDGAATSASFYRPFGIAVDASGNIYVSDQGLNTVREISQATGAINTLAGTPGQACTTYPTGCGDNGTPTAALLNQPAGLAVSLGLQNGVPQVGATDIFIADSGDNVIRKVSITTGLAVVETISTVAFDGVPTFGGDGGSALSASMYSPTYVAVDNLENLFIGGGFDKVVRRVDAFTADITTIAGDISNLNGGFSGDGGPATQALIENTGLAVFNRPQFTHDLFLADSGSNRIRKVNLAPVSFASPTSGSTLAFPITLDGQTNRLGIDVINSGPDDLIISNLSVTGDPSFTATSSCGASSTIAPPQRSCGIAVTFAPAQGASGTLSATLTFSTNDPANPTLTYNLTGTATATTFNLTVSLTPAANSSTPGGQVYDSSFKIDCISNTTFSNCSAAFPAGTQVTLTAFPDTNFAFTSWGGACAGVTGPSCTVTMNQVQSASAVFTSSTPPPPTPMTINVVGFGNGSGTVSDGANLNCTITNGVTSGACSAQYPSGGQTSVSLAATAGTNSTFVGWLGQQCSSSYNQSPCPIFAGSGTVTVGAVFSGPAQPFASGQVFLSTDFGMVFVIDGTTGQVVQVLSSGATGGSGGGNGLTFDSSGNLYLAMASANRVEEFTSSAGAPTLFGSGYQSPWSSLVEPAGSLLVGQEGQQGDFTTAPTVVRVPQSATPTISATFSPGFDLSTQANWIELLDTNDTIAYTFGNGTVKVFDLGEQIQHPDMTASLSGAFALRELPDDTLLVADSFRIVRIDQSGTIKQIYSIPGTEALFHNLNLDPDGQSFWTNDEFTGTLYRINIQTGAVMNGSGYSTGLGTSGASGLFTEGIGGIAVFGQALSGGTDLSVTMSGPSAVQAGSNVTYSLSVSNNGPLNTTGVTLTASIPNSTLVSLSPNTCSSTSNAQGTNITCPIGALAANSPSVPATFTVSLNSSGTITATANVSGSQSDPNVANNTATVTTSTGPVCTLNVVPTSGIAPLQVNETFSCTDAAGSLVSTTVDFGDGITASTSGVTHTYSAAGTYTVKLTALDNLQLTGTATQTVTVSANQPPACTLTVSPNSGPLPLAVIATGNCTDPEQDITSTSLDFGDGTVVPNATSGTHTYSKAGTYTLKVSATDKVGQTGSATQVVTVAVNQPPVCTLSVSPTSGTPPLNVTATGSCTDAENDITSTSLDFGDGTKQTATSGPHSYTTAGTYTVTLSAVDAVGQTSSATQTVTVNANNFPPGVFVGIEGGTVLQLASDGTVLKTLSTGLGGTLAGMAFDKSGILYALDFTAGNASKFDLKTGTMLGTFGSGYNCQPETIVFDGAGNAYVGQQGCSRNILKLDPSGKVLTTYSVKTENQGSDDIDLSADQCTLLYTSEGPSVLRYDVCKNQQLTPFATGLKKALTLRILPDGGVIVADLTDIVRLNASGQIMTTYTAPGEQCLYAVALDQDGTSFWAGDYCSSNIYRFDIASGKQLTKFNTGTPSGSVFGIAIAGTGLNVAGLGNAGAFTASPGSATLSTGQSTTFTVSLTANSASAGRTLALSCAGLPAGLSCSFTPSSIALGAAGTTTTATLTITRTTTAALFHSSSTWALATWMGVIPAIVLASRRPRKRRSPLLWIGLIVVGVGLWSSCGGNGQGMSQSTTPPPTPQGTYNVIVVGAGSGVQSSTTVTVTVQ